MRFLFLLIAMALPLLAPTVSPALANGLPNRSFSNVVQDSCGGRFGGAYIGVNYGGAQLTGTLVDYDQLVDRGQTTQWMSGQNYGGTFGYDFRHCASVFGLAVDLSRASINSTNSYFVGEEVVGRRLDWFGSVRARTGLAHSNMLFYLTGGLAFAQPTLTYVNTDFVPPVNETYSGKWRTGYVIGVGAEHAYSDRVTLTTEVLFYDFGTKSYQIVQAGDAFKIDDHLSMWVARIGLNIKLDQYDSSPRYARPNRVWTMK
ncbi:MAG: outer membrane beta-barrel protein [Hyphomicrobiales bacterium]|nr:outer membrane beta-barrel protein [Hyphomicrobiales bacterium]